MMMHFTSITVWYIIPWSTRITVIHRYFSWIKKLQHNNKSNLAGSGQSKSDIRNPLSLLAYSAFNLATSLRLVHPKTSFQAQCIFTAIYKSPFFTNILSCIAHPFWLFCIILQHFYAICRMSFTFLHIPNVTFATFRCIRHFHRYDRSTSPEHDTEVLGCLFDHYCHCDCNLDDITETKISLVLGGLKIYYVKF